MFIAPSALGLRPTGVEEGGIALVQAGLVERLKARDVQVIAPPPYRDAIDSHERMRNLPELCAYAKTIGEMLGERLKVGEFPVVLGGDCSILLGSMLALRRQGRHGLLFLDGHADFYTPETSPTGEAADMDLALVTGRGPSLLTNIDGLRPLVRDEDVVAFGHRDADEAHDHGALSLDRTAITSIDLQRIKKEGLKSLVTEALAIVTRHTTGFWTHLDVDVLSDVEMPAVDYLMPEGLSFAELRESLSTILASPSALGIEITIFNPRLDPDGVLAQRLVDLIAAALQSRICEVANGAAR